MTFTFFFEENSLTQKVKSDCGCILKKHYHQHSNPQKFNYSTLLLHKIQRAKELRIKTRKDFSFSISTK